MLDESISHILMSGNESVFGETEVNAIAQGEPWSLSSIHRLKITKIVYKKVNRNIHDLLVTSIKSYHCIC